MVPVDCAQAGAAVSKMISGINTTAVMVLMYIFQSSFVGRGTSTSEMNQMCSRCSARMVIVG